MIKKIIKYYSVKCFQCSQSSIYKLISTLPHLSNILLLWLVHSMIYLKHSDLSHKLLKNQKSFSFYLIFDFLEVYLTFLNTCSFLKLLPAPLLHPLVFLPSLSWAPNHTPHLIYLLFSPSMTAFFLVQPLAIHSCHYTPSLQGTSSTFRAFTLPDYS